MNPESVTAKSAPGGAAASTLHLVNQNRLDAFPGLWLGSTAIQGRGDQSPVHAPATGRLLGLVRDASIGQVDLAVRKARDAHIEWRHASSATRSACLHRIADALCQEQADFCELQELSNGKPAAEAAADVADAIATYRYYARTCAGWDNLEQEPVSVGDGGFEAERRYVPVGVAALVLPWNFPLVTAAWKIAPALAAGCTVVVKPSEVAPLPEHALALLISRCGLPDGVVNWVFGDADIGQALVQHPGVDKVSFTGSTAVGRMVMQAATQRFTRLGLELGGKSSLIVCSSADVEHAAQLAASGIFSNAGQMCSATSRLLVHSSLQEAFSNRLAALAQALRPVSVATPGHGAYGPLISRNQQAKVLSMVRTGIDDGLTLLAGGRTPPEAPHGFFVEPTVFAQVPAHHPLWREEIFGPVACVRSFESDEEAIAAANDTEYGLAATVVGEDSDAINRIARALRAGIVWQNTPQMVFPEVGWGGFGSSGIGRELGTPGLRAYQEAQHLLRHTQPD